MSELIIRRQICGVCCSLCVCVVLLLCVMGPAVGEPSVVFELLLFGGAVVVVMGGCPCEGRVLVVKSCLSLQVSSFGLVRLVREVLLHATHTHTHTRSH